MKTGQCGMKFSMKRKRGRREAVNACDCYATVPYSSSCSRTRVRSVARIWYKLPYSRIIQTIDRGLPGALIEAAGACPVPKNCCRATL
ncbi:hypothetical protein Y032_0130g1528 [Ancylostoma ceylanicum]|uniref:Uncharacterized protein n=1 Tax=Ancylostoma ceylanicum TaxID=53326 RepID=A0A016T7I3_9BILA|nr:hypothetical protein Y032_0130g1528 [Ancylostoma ceylanicum]